MLTDRKGKTARCPSKANDRDRVRRNTKRHFCQIKSAPKPSCRKSKSICGALKRNDANLSSNARSSRRRKGKLKEFDADAWRISSESGCFANFKRYRKPRLLHTISFANLKISLLILGQRDTGEGHRCLNSTTDGSCTNSTTC